MTVLITERLRLTPLCENDTAEIHALWTSQGVRRYLFDDSIITSRQTAEMVGESRRLQDDEGAGLWSVRLLGREDLLGFAGYWYFREPPSLELVYGIAEEWWGQGIATDAARTMLCHGFEALGFRRVVASTDAANAASVRVLEKIGMSLHRQAVVDGIDTVFYAIAREQWLAERGSEPMSN